MNLTCLYCNKIMDRAIKDPNETALSRAREVNCNLCNTTYRFAFPNDILLLFFNVKITPTIIIRICPKLDKAIVLNLISRSPYEHRLIKFKLFQIAHLSIPQLKTKIINLLPFI